MATPITVDDVIMAILIVAILLIITSVPSILLTVRHSSKLLKRYKILRSIDNLDNEKVSEQTLNEWNAVKSQMAYTTLITEELEKLSGLKPAFFQAELAAVIIIILAIVPGFSDPTPTLTIIMVAVAVISILSVFYAAANTVNYRREYLGILKEMSDNEKESNNGAADGMYG